MRTQNNGENKLIEFCKEITQKTSVPKLGKHFRWDRHSPSLAEGRDTSQKDCLDLSAQNQERDHE